MKFWSRLVMAAAVAFAVSAASAYAASPAPPSRVTYLSAAAGDQQVTVAWRAPATGTPPFAYTLTATPGGYSTTDTSTSRTLNNLTNGTVYTFKVFAKNSAGAGPISTATATPHPTPPGPPTNLAATSGPGAGQITISWTPPTSTGSSPDGTPPNIDHYTVTVSPGGIRQQTNSATITYVASNLADNITYTFNVTATNSRSVTGPAATVYAPLPTGATIGLEPTAGGADTSITASGQFFLKNESITLYWDDPRRVAGAVVTDGNGNFTKVVKPFAGDKPQAHKLCASVPPKPCATFTLQGSPTPTPDAASPSPADTPTPTPSDTPRASAARAGSGGISGLDVLTRPPFVFLPIIGILGLLGVIAYWALSGRRRPMAPTSATITHLATRPDYMAPFPTTAGTPPAIPPAAAPPPQVQPPAPPPPPPPAAPPPTWPPPIQPPPPTWPAAPDEPPDLPEPSD